MAPAIRSAIISAVRAFILAPSPSVCCCSLF
jgi:hypothetical protein